MTTLTAWAFPGADDAETAVERLQALQSEAAITIDDVKQKVMPGTSALFILTDDTVVDRVENALKDMNPHLIASNLTAEQEAKLREAFAEE